MNNNKQKLKILVCSEAHYVSSGFGIYNKELLTRLHNTGKYEIAEFASYGSISDPRSKSVPWKFYANMVSDNDARHKEYSSITDNQFGRWRFEKVLLDFRPNVVIDVRDYWMSSYQALSPLRPFFHWILMPTVDSAPQQEPWLDTYLSADAIFTYSDWGAEVLKQQTSNTVNYIDTVSPGVDLDIFQYYPLNKRQSIRKSYNIPEDAFIVGSVMRNQKRKLIPELMRAFRQFLDILSERKDPRYSKSFLYLHTSYPDAGWDIPNLIKEYNLYNHVLLTYTCKSCHDIKCLPFVGPSVVCDRCKNRSMTTSSVMNGITTPKLVEIYNLFDLYVQYAICEGFGMPQAEAGSCGVPIATIAYSAMNDIIQKLEAYKINVNQEFLELETKAIRTYPKNQDLIDIMSKMIDTPQPIMEQKRLNTRKLTSENYSWDSIIEKWVKYLDTIDPENCSPRSWSEPPKILEEIPEQLINDTIPLDNHMNVLTMICSRYLQDLKYLSSMLILDMLMSSDYGFVQAGINISPYKINSVIQGMNAIIRNNNSAETARAQSFKSNEDFIVFANAKNQL
jgi:glycosyltransferase involved in cell wall biosynthesis